MPDQLEHRFVHGLLFDAALQYPAHAQSGGRSLKPLPVRRTSDSDEAISLCLVQAVGILAGLHPKQLKDRIRNAATAQSFLRDGQWTLGDGSELARRLVSELNVQLEAWHGRSAHSLLNTSRRELLLACMQRQQGYRWGLVVGVERMVLMPSSPDRALLLLDLMAPEPWGCGYNAKLDLSKDSSRTIGRVVSANLPLAYRDVDGFSAPVDLLGFLRLTLRVAGAP